MSLKLIKECISSLISLRDSSVVLLKLVERSEADVSYSDLLSKFKMDGLESGETTDAISDISQTYICDLKAANSEEVRY